MPISKSCHAFIIKPDRTKTTKPKPSFSSLSYYIFDMNYYNLFPTPTWPIAQERSEKKVLTENRRIK